MSWLAMFLAALCIALFWVGNVAYGDPLTYRDDFESYSNNSELRDVWDPDSRVTLGQQNGNQYLRRRVAPSAGDRAEVWVCSSLGLEGGDLDSEVRCTEVNSGYAYFYVREGGFDYRSVIGYPLSTGMNWATFRLSDIAPEDFIEFDGGSDKPDLTAPERLGLTFWVNTDKLGAQYMEVDNFAVAPEPSVLLTLGLPCVFLGRTIFRNRRREARPEMKRGALSRRH